MILALWHMLSDTCYLIHAIWYLIHTTCLKHNLACKKIVSFLFCCISHSSSYQIWLEIIWYNVCFYHTLYHIDFKCLIATFWLHKNHPKIIISTSHFYEYVQLIADIIIMFLLPYNHCIRMTRPPLFHLPLTGPLPHPWLLYNYL